MPDLPRHPVAAGTATKPDAIGHRDVLAIAVPVMISNMTTPLVGLVDTMVIGQTGAAHSIGGVAVGALVFSVLYWSFSFLRMGTTGLAAQAVGACDGTEVAATLGRAAATALALGLVLIAVRSGVVQVALTVVSPSSEVAAAVAEYCGWRIWGAPAGLLNFALLGWFFGLGRAGFAVTTQLVLNGVNIALAYVLVLRSGLGVSGVGIAALVAEWTGALTGICLAMVELRRRRAHAPLRAVLTLAPLARMLAINRDITLRSLALLAAQVFFTRRGAIGGDVVLAANAVLITINNVTIYSMDGFAHAAETLVGQSIGARHRGRFRRAVLLSTAWAGAISLAGSAAIWLFGPVIIDQITPNPELRIAARLYLPWAALVPIVGVWCFQLDGIFIGATRTADMRNMMLVSFAGFLTAWWALQGFGNHGLWLALLVLFLLRGVTLAIRYRALERHWFER